jgi:hypothetical protein
MHFCENCSDCFSDELKSINVEAAWKSVEEKINKDEANNANGSR